MDLETTAALPRLFTPFTLRGLTLRNRIVVSPMSQYSAIEGQVQDWHRHHLAAQGRGGAALVMVEASAVSREGRGTWGDLGIWSDAHLPGLTELADVIRGGGALPAIQIGHAGRKASVQRPWEGNRPLVSVPEAATSSEPAWAPVAPSAIALGEGWPVPQALDLAGMAHIIEDFSLAAMRAAAAGFRWVEIHAAHGYLLHSFLSPLSNHRKDGHGGDLERRMRFPLEVAAAVRRVLPGDVVLSVRVSAVDGFAEGWQLADTVQFARALKNEGVDVVDCSSGGILGTATAASSKDAIARGPGFQVGFAQAVREQAGIPVIAVGLITTAMQAEAILVAEQADLIAIGREALIDSNWPLRASRSLGMDKTFAEWPQQYGWWLQRRAGGPATHPEP